MNINQFKTKLTEICNKTCIMPFELPFSYDEDEIGDLYIREDGIIFIADDKINWIESYFSLNDLENIRFSNFSDGSTSHEFAESQIIIHFKSGEHITIYKDVCNDRFDVSIYYKETDQNKDIIIKLKEQKRKHITFIPLNMFCN